MALNPWNGTDPWFGGGRGGDMFSHQLERSIDRAFNRALGGAGGGGLGGMLTDRPMSGFTDVVPWGGSMTSMMPSTAGWIPMDVHETDKNYEITADAPGFKPEEVTVQVNDGNLMIQGEHREERGTDVPTDGRRPWRRERMHRSFTRTFRLPDNVKQDDVQAQLDNGLLKVTVAKLEETQRPMPKRIPVLSGGSTNGKMLTGEGIGGATPMEAGATATGGTV